MKKIKLFTIFMTLVLFGSLKSMAQISVSPWRMHEGNEGVVQFRNTINGDPRAYEKMKIPAKDDKGWKDAPKDSKGNVYLDRTSTLKCREQLDFTYFETTVNIPANMTVNEFKVSYDKADDGARIYFFNSKFPNGTFDPKADLIIANGRDLVGSVNLKDKVVAGENRVVIVQFDDCADRNSVHNIRISVNGNEIKAAPVNTTKAISTSGMTNIAKGKKCKASSVNYGGDASRAVDGNTSGDYGKNSCTHTNDEDNPWWEIDLGDYYDVSKIVIWNRTDECCWNRLQGFYVMASENAISSNSTSAEYQFKGSSYSFSSGSQASMSIDGNKRCRYIRIFIPGKMKILSLSEVEVFGKLSSSKSVSSSSAGTDLGTSLEFGKEIGVNQRITSANGQYHAIMQQDGNFCVYKGSSFVWGSMTNGKGGMKCGFRKDGNFCMYNSGGSVVWSTESHTVGSAGSGCKMIVDNNGVLCIVNASGQNIWTSKQGLIKSDSSSSAGTNLGTSLEFGKEIGVNQRITSANGQYHAIMQQDGNFCVYKGSSFVWGSMTNGKGGMKCGFRKDGNFCMYNSGGSVVWSTESHTVGSAGSGCKMIVDNNGVLCIVNASGQNIWTSKQGLIKSATEQSSSALAVAMPDKFKVHAFSVNEGKNEKDDYWFALKANSTKGEILSGARLVNGAKWMEIQRVDLGGGVIAFKVLNAGADMYLVAKDNKEVHIQKFEGGKITDACKFKTVNPLTSAPGSQEKNYRSFESVKFANHYLRHQGYVLFVHTSNNTELFKQDASWLIQKM